MFSSSFLQAFQAFLREGPTLKTLMDVLKYHEEEWKDLDETYVIPLFRPIARKVMPLSASCLSPLTEELRRAFVNPVIASDILVTFLQGQTYAATDILSDCYSFSLDSRILRLASKTIPWSGTSPAHPISTARFKQHQWALYCYFQLPYKSVFQTPPSYDFFQRLLNGRNPRLEWEVIQDMCQLDDSLLKALLSRRHHQNVIWNWLSQSFEESILRINGRNLSRLLTHMFHAHASDWPLPKGSFKLLHTWQELSGCRMPVPPILWTGSRRERVTRLHLLESMFHG